jgi:hypothetical protein
MRDVGFFHGRILLSRMRILVSPSQNLIIDADNVPAGAIQYGISLCR